jgi:hypothetical protein
MLPYFALPPKTKLIVAHNPPDKTATPAKTSTGLAMKIASVISTPILIFFSRCATRQLRVARRARSRGERQHGGSGWTGRACRNRLARLGLFDERVDFWFPRS